MPTWVLLTFVCAFSQASWMALSKLRLQSVGRLRFAILLRTPIILLILPLALREPVPVISPELCGVFLICGLLECARLLLLGTGLRKDYFSTYALLNTSPLFVLLLGPALLGEKLTSWVLLGAFLVASGGLVFFRIRRVFWLGAVLSIVQAAVTTFTKVAINESSPMIALLTIVSLSTLMVGGLEVTQRGAKPLAEAFRNSAMVFLPLCLLNFMAMITYTEALARAPVTEFAVVMRTNMIFGFILSLWLLKELEGWRWKLAGSILIAAGTAVITF